MTSQSREIEFKFGVSGTSAFERLLQHLELPVSLLHSGVTQTNHFFDSPSWCLHEHHFVIRLRDTGGSYALTIKGEHTSEETASGVLSNRIEEEVMIPQAAAEGLLRGKLSPRQAVSDHFAGRSAALVEMIENACQGQQLVRIGQFTNERIHLPPVSLTVGDSREQLVFELDTSTFPGNRIEHELEVEIKAHSNAAGIEAALIALLREAGIEWHAAPSKAVRFFAAIESGAVTE